MKAPSPGPGTDAFVQYLCAHSAILTDQGVNVRAFIDGLSGLKGSPTGAKQSSSAPKKKHSTGRVKRKPSPSS